MKIELNPCPVCGGEARLTGWTNSDAEIAGYVYCKDCGTHSGVSNSIEEAVSSWNALPPVKPDGGAKIKLNPCPYCGGEAGISVWTNAEQEFTAYAYCKACLSINGLSHSIDEAVNKWNTRVFSEEDVETMRNAYAACPEHKHECHCSPNVYQSAAEQVLDAPF